MVWLLSRPRPFARRCQDGGFHIVVELDIYRSAQVLVKRHGEDAPIHAAMRADAMLETGDLEGAAVWKRIVKAVEELLSKERPTGVTVQ